MHMQAEICFKIWILPSKNRPKIKNIVKKLEKMSRDTMANPFPTLTCDLWWHRPATTRLKSMTYYLNGPLLQYSVDCHFGSFFVFLSSLSKEKKIEKSLIIFFALRSQSQFHASKTFFRFYRFIKATLSGNPLGLTFNFRKHERTKSEEHCSKYCYNGSCSYIWINLILSRSLIACLCCPLQNST